MIKTAAKVTLIMVLSVAFLLGTALAAEARTPRWPEPAWFAQFGQWTQPSKPPVPAQPEPPAEEPPSLVEPPAPEPQPTKPASQPAWLSPEWFAWYSSNQGGTAKPDPSTPPAQENAPGENPTGHQLTAQELQLANLVNQERSRLGIGTLQIDPELSKWARIKSQDMVDNDYFAHQSPTYGGPSTMLRNAGVKGKYFGENIAMTTSVTRAHDLFMGSSVHRAQIQNGAYTHLGIGIAYKGSTIYVTQLFAAR